MVKELFEYLNKKASSTLIFVFIVFWIICHSQGFATMFFTDQNLIYQKYGMLKNEYLNQYFFGNICDYDFWVRTLLPFFLTWFYIWIMPKLIINRAYKKQINDKIDREIIKEEAQQKLIKEQKETTKEEIAIKKEQVKLAEENKKLEDKTPEKVWKKEYEEFTKKENYGSVLSQLKNVIYGHQGYIRPDRITSENLMSCDTNGLININGNTSTCSITDKGKYFLKQFASENE
ncbi:hypothetical protein IJJ36_02000 [Candidatus Saccharibacteria bacterium]|nr:hypothetical protein [Candidatus Saccharibacteria bacterium]